jgi:hypothetical protein
MRRWGADWRQAGSWRPGTIDSQGPPNLLERDFQTTYCLGWHDAFAPQRASNPAGRMMIEFPSVIPGEEFASALQRRGK